MHSCWQVAALGCRSFAVLFDDINCDMCPADAKEFPSFAHAQVTVTNDIYSHLDQPDVFLFCPTGNLSICADMYMKLNIISLHISSASLNLTALLRLASAEGGAHTYFIDVSDIHAFTHCV